ncbi:MAG: NUDIX domain-containing protein [Clostridia bacterium]|nr:NUDIX domain-containing protein [Clostridia bacterium]
MEYGPDLCVPCGDGLLNVRVGAIIVKDGKALMVKSRFGDYCYSVGGRIRFGETAEQAVVREVFEETGATMTVDRLGYVSEVYFYNDSPKLIGKPVYELAFYFYMNAPADFAPASNHIADGEEPFVWVAPDEPVTLYPNFIREALLDPKPYVVHDVRDDR